MSCGRTVRWHALWKWPGVAVGVQVLCRSAGCLCARTWAGNGQHVTHLNTSCTEHEPQASDILDFSPYLRKHTASYYKRRTTYTAFNPVFKQLTTVICHFTKCLLHVSALACPSSLWSDKWCLLFVALNFYTIISLLHRTWNIFYRPAGCLLW